MSGDDLEFEDPDPDPESGAQPLLDVDVPITIAASDGTPEAEPKSGQPAPADSRAIAHETENETEDDGEGEYDPTGEELPHAASPSASPRSEATPLSLPFPTADEPGAPASEPERGRRRRMDGGATDPSGRASTTPNLDDEGTPHLIAIASGRGGAGKSLLAANIAVYLAQIGKRVVTVDADPAGGALHHMLGASRPARGFASFLRGHVSLDELAVDTPVSGVRLVAGELQAFGAPRPKMAAKTVLAALRALGADTVVVDLGGADLPLCIDLWLGADTPIVVTLSDPPSIEATYRFVKSAFLRLVRAERGLDKLQGQLGRPLPAPLDLYRAALEAGRADREPTDDGAASAEPPTSRSSAAKASTLATALGEAMAAYRPRFVVSQTRSLGDTRLGPQMALAAHRRLGHRLDYLGHMEADETVTAASRRHRPVMAEFPEAKICKNIERIVRRILSAETARPGAATPPRLEEDQTFYEILETQPGVSDEEVRRAYRVMKEIYAGGSAAVFGLYDEGELSTLHARANAAHDTLFAPERRRLYDLSLPEADLARAVRRAPQASSSTPGPSRSDPAPSAGAAPALDDSVEITGALLKKIRETRGLDLSEIAQRTKISERYLRSIEDERFDELPAPVYVRGFVLQMARLLHIDATRAAEGFLRRFHGANGPGAGTPTLKEL